MAKIVSISQRGTYIDEQPEVKFALEFQDRGVLYTVKKIVPLIELGRCGKQKRKSKGTCTHPNGRCTIPYRYWNE